MRISYSVLATDSGSGSAAKPKTGGATKPAETPKTEQNGAAKTYDGLLKELSKIERNYSTYYTEPELGLPDSLGTEKLSYVMPTAGEIWEQAEKSLATKYYSEEADIRGKAKKNANSIADKIDQAELNALFKIGGLAEELEENKTGVKRDALKRGLARSSIAENAVKETEEAYEREQNNVLGQKDANVNLMKKQIYDLQALTNEALEALGNSKSLEMQAATQKLLADVVKKQEEIIKYNNSLESNEAKYQASLSSKAAEAQTNEYRRAAEIQKLLAEVGEEGLARIVEREKYYAVIDYIDTLTKREAHEMLLTSRDLPKMLGTYYQWVQDYVQNKK